MDFAKTHYTNNCVEFGRIDTNLTSLGFSDEQKNGIYKILFAILNLGNIQFENYHTANDGCFIKENSQPFLDNLTALMKIDKSTLKDVFINRIIEVSGSEIR